MSGSKAAGTPGAGTQQPRFALVGCGEFGKHLARYAAEHAELAALCDPAAGNLAATASDLSTDVPRYGDYRELLRRERLDAVLVTAANHVHGRRAVSHLGRGLRCVEMMEGAYRSAQRDGRVVEFPLHPELEP